MASDTEFDLTAKVLAAEEYAELADDSESKITNKRIYVNLALQGLPQEQWPFLYFVTSARIPSFTRVMGTQYEDPKTGIEWMIKDGYYLDVKALEQGYQALTQIVNGIRQAKESCSSSVL